MNTNSKPNHAEFFSSDLRDIDLSWVNKNTAIVVVHGIGDQLPLETLDLFGRGLVSRYRRRYEDKISITHEIVSKPDNRGSHWFDNVLRIRREGSEHYIDLYEYYWADYTEDKAEWKDINKWLQGVVKGAKSFYKKHAQLGKQYMDKSLFFHPETGEFRYLRYRLFISMASKFFFFIDTFWSGLLWLVSFIPFFGKIANALLQKHANGLVRSLTNVIGDIVVYNVVDPKSKFYNVRRKILDGAVTAIQYVLEKTNNGQPSYPSVIVAGHSLGSQVAYDAINKINLLINKGKIETYDEKGFNNLNKQPVSKQLSGFVTFGSPLDKIVFFLRENVPDEMYIRQQFLANYHGFKQRDFNISNGEPIRDYVKCGCDLNRYLEDVKWRNYFDGTDYVSGGLDYYTGLTNIDCAFKAKMFGFTHSNYWTSDKFYRDFIYHFLGEEKVLHSTSASSSALETAAT